MAKFEFTYRSATGADYLYYDGPVIEVCVSAPVPLLAYLREHRLPAFPAIKGLAVIDRGASVSVLEEDVMAELEIPFLKTIQTYTIHGTAETRCYNASVNLPSLRLPDIPMNYVPGGSVRSATNLGGDVIMLLGRDLLRRFVVRYDGTNSRVTIES